MPKRTLHVVERLTFKLVDSVRQTGVTGPQPEVLRFEVVVLLLQGKLVRFQQGQPRLHLVHRVGRLSFVRTAARETRRCCSGVGNSARVVAPLHWVGYQQGELPVLVGGTRQQSA